MRRKGIRHVKAGQPDPQVFVQAVALSRKRRPPKGSIRSPWRFAAVRERKGRTVDFKTTGPARESDEQ
jgi:hypothetical protein